jgi:RNA polymerase sigma factor (sigma-70 family)
MGVHQVHAAITTSYVQTMIRVKARQLIRRPGFSPSDQPDVEQDLVAVVLKEAHLFDPARGTVHTFISRVVKSAAAMIVRDRGRLKRAPESRVLSLDEPDFNAAVREENTLAANVQKADLLRRQGRVATEDNDDRVQALDIGNALAGLPPHVREIAARLAEDSESSVARDLGISRRQVRKAIAQIRDALAAAGLVGILAGGGPISDRTA